MGWFWETQRLETGVFEPRETCRVSSPLTFFQIILTLRPQVLDERGVGRKHACRIGKFCPYTREILEQKCYRNQCQMPSVYVLNVTAWVPGTQALRRQVSVQNVYLGVFLESTLGQKETLGCDAVAVEASSGPSGSSEAVKWCFRIVVICGERTGLVLLHVIWKNIPRGAIIGNLNLEQKGNGKLVIEPR